MMKIKILFVFAAILFVCIGNVNAIVVKDLVEVSDAQWHGILDYESITDYTDESARSIGVNNGMVSIVARKLYAPEISNLAGLNTLIYAQHDDSSSYMQDYDSVYIDSKIPITYGFDCDYKIGSDVIGNGEFQVTMIKQVIYPYDIKNAIVIYTFENWDVSGYSGAQIVTIDYDDVQGLDVFTSAGWSTITGDTSNAVPAFDFVKVAASQSLALYDTDYGEIAYNMIFPYGGYLTNVNCMVESGLDITVYHNIDFEQDFYFTDFEDYYSFEYTKNSNGNYISVVDSVGNYLYSSNDIDDISVNFFNYNIPYVLNVTNPFVTDGETYDYFEWVLPPEEDEDLIVNVYDADSYAIIVGPSVTVTDDITSSNETQISTYGESLHFTIDPTHTYTITANKTGYDPYEASYTPAYPYNYGVYLVPELEEVSGSHYLHLYVKDSEHLTAVFNAAVKISNSTKTYYGSTAPSGYVAFRLQDGEEYSLSISKTDYYSLTDTVNITADTSKTVYLTALPDATPTWAITPTATGTGGVTPTPVPWTGDEDQIMDSGLNIYLQFHELIIMVGCLAILLGLLGFCTPGRRRR